MIPRAVVALSFAFAFLSCELAFSQSKRPNILLILGDNWSYPHASALGDKTVRTPAFDRVAREGVLFHNAFCPVPSCSPTRSCVLTGRAAHQLAEAASLWSAFPKSLRVYPDMLRDAGYFIGSMGKGWSPGLFAEYGWTDNPAGKVFADFDTFLAERPKDSPFCYWMGFVLPARHTWIEGAGAANGLSATSVTVPPCLPDVPEVRQNLLDYYEAVERLDAAVSEALDLVDRQGLAEETIVVFGSDNGWQLPRGLANVYDTGTHVPLAVRWPNRFPAGRVVDDFVCLTDLAPTFLELAGLPAPADMTGQSFADLLRGQPSGVNRDQVFIERERHANVRKGDLSYPVRAVRNRDFLYIHNLRPDRWPAGDPEFYWAVGEFGDVDPSPAKDFVLSHANDPKVRPYFDLIFGKRPEEELYDLRVDPGQVANVAADPKYADTLAELRRSVETWMRDTHDPRIDPTVDVWDTFPYFGVNARTRSLASPMKPANE